MPGDFEFLLTLRLVAGAVTAFRIQELHTFPHAEVQANDVAEESDSDEGTPYS
jgi:flagellar biogenesis protein FliO